MGQAISILDRAVRTNDRCVDSRNQLGEAYAESGKPDEAIRQSRNPSRSLRIKKVPIRTGQAAFREGR